MPRCKEAAAGPSEYSGHRVRSSLVDSTAWHKSLCWLSDCCTDSDNCHRCVTARLVRAKRALTTTKAYLLSGVHTLRDRTLLVSKITGLVPSAKDGVVVSQNERSLDFKCNAQHVRTNTPRFSQLDFLDGLVFIDGVELNRATAVGTSARARGTGRLVIGKRWNDDPSVYTSSIRVDELLLWNHVLSNQEIRDLYLYRFD